MRGLPASPPRLARCVSAQCDPACARRIYRYCERFCAVFYVLVVPLQFAYIGGGFQATYPTGIWTSFGPALMNIEASTDPRIHFAGTEWPESNGGMFFGYVEGAIASGLAAAKAIVTRLARPPV